MHIPHPKITAFILFIIVLFIASTTITYLVINSGKKAAASPGPSIRPRASITPSPTPKKENTYSLLLIGHGGVGHDGGSLSDVLMLIHANLDTKKITYISIPRDTWLDNQKINNRFAAGGATAAKNAVEIVTGITPDYYVSIDFSGFVKAIDALGGVDVNVPATFDDKFYPIKGKEEELCGKSPEEMQAIHATMSGYLLEQQFTCRYEQLHFTKGLTHMDGVTALKFVRSRHSDTAGGDFSRSQRQQALLSAIKSKALSLGALKSAWPFFSQFKAMIRSDISESAVNFIVPMITEPASFSYSAVNLTIDNVLTNITAANGAYALIPKEGDGNWAGVRQYIKDNL